MTPHTTIHTEPKPNHNFADRQLQDFQIFQFCKKNGQIDSFRIFLDFPIPQENWSKPNHNFAYGQLQNSFRYSNSAREVVGWTASEFLDFPILQEN